MEGLCYTAVRDLGKARRMQRQPRPPLVARL